jgi:alkylation response protein AidB-like acyl-CoA dehydrogenase
MVVTLVSEHGLIEQLRELEPLIRRSSAWSEENCRMHPEVFAALSEARLFSIWKPTGLGGLELDPLAGLRIFEEAARIEPAVGWTLANQNGIDTFACSMLPEKGAAEVVSDPTRPVSGGWFPPGRADVVEGGYRVTGQWAFASTCHYAQYLTGMGILHEGGTPQLGPDGNPTAVIVYFPTDEARIVDNWDTLGMRGTGSHDIAIQDLFVPERRAWRMSPLPAAGRTGPFAGPLYEMTPWLPVGTLGPIGIGIGQAAIDELVTLATQKIPSYLTKTLRDKEVAQANVARARAQVGAARCYLHDAMRTVWEAAVDRRRATMEEGLELQLAVCNAMETGSNVVNLVHDTVGTSGIRHNQRFQQLYRDARTISQHTFGGVARYESAGKVFFGLPSDWGFYYL